jgi:hypothetical protein
MLKIKQKNNYFPFEAEARPNIFNNPVCTSKRTLLFTNTKVNWLMLFKEITAVYSENHTKPTNRKDSLTD